MSYLDHLITDPKAPVTREWCAKVEAYKRTVPANVRRARKVELAAGYVAHTRTPKAPAVRGETAKGGTVNEALAAWWKGANDGSASVTAVIRLASRAFPDISKADFVTTLVSLGVNPSTASIQFVKGRREC